MAPARPRGRPLQLLWKTLAVEDVVAQDQGHPIPADELAADQEGLGQPLGLGLNRVANRDAQPAAVAQQPLETADVLRRRDQQDVANARQHQHRQRIVDHRLVVDGQELLADGPRDGVEPGAGAAGQNDSLGGGRSSQD